MYKRSATNWASTRSQGRRTEAEAALLGAACFRNTICETVDVVVVKLMNSSMGLEKYTEASGAVLPY